MSSPETSPHPHPPLAGPFAQLEQAFAALAPRGVVARMDFTCCQTCGVSEIDDERTPATRADSSADYPHAEHGYVFFHQQDTDRIRDPEGELLLSFGAFPGGPLAPATRSDEDADAWRRTIAAGDREVGETVAAELRAAGLDVDWNGDPEARIAVRADWGSAPFPWPEDEDVEDDAVPIPGPDAEALFVLLDHVPASIGEPLAEFMPNWSAQLREEDAQEATFPLDDEDFVVHVALEGRIDDPALAAAAARSADPDALGAAIAAHRASVRIWSEGAGSSNDQITREIGIATGLSTPRGATALWIPYAERIERDGDAVLDGTDQLVYIAAHRDRTPDEGEFLVTRGLRRHDLPELVAGIPDDFDDAACTVLRQVLLLRADTIRESGRRPALGRSIRVARRLRGEFHPAQDPLTGEEALELRLETRRPILGIW